MTFYGFLFNRVKILEFDISSFNRIISRNIWILGDSFRPLKAKIPLEYTRFHKLSEDIPEHTGHLPNRGICLTAIH